MKPITDYLHLYLGTVCVKHEATFNYQKSEHRTLTAGFLNEIENYPQFAHSVKLVLRPVSKMTDDELKKCALILLHIPKKTNNFIFEIHRHSNSVGGACYSPHFLSGQYFSIWNETDKNPGHCEVGWYQTEREIKEHPKMNRSWVVGAQHELTVYLLKQGIDIFNLIKQGLAIEKPSPLPDEKFYCADWDRCGSICEQQCPACEKTNNL